LQITDGQDRQKVIKVTAT